MVATKGGRLLVVENLQNPTGFYLKVTENGVDLYKGKEGEKGDEEDVDSRQEAVLSVEKETTFDEQPAI